MGAWYFNYRGNGYGPFATKSDAVRGLRGKKLLPKNYKYQAEHCGRVMYLTDEQLELLQGRG